MGMVIAETPSWVGLAVTFGLPPEVIASARERTRQGGVVMLEREPGALPVLHVIEDVPGSFPVHHAGFPSYQGVCWQGDGRGWRLRPGSEFDPLQEVIPRPGETFFAEEGVASEPAPLPQQGLPEGGLPGSPTPRDPLQLSLF